MNTLAKTFSQLVAVVRDAPESQHADELAADLLAQLEQLPERSACVGLAHRTSHHLRSYPRTVHVLEPLGVTLTRRRRARGGMLIFASLAAPEPAAPVLVLEQPVLKRAA